MSQGGVNNLKFLNDEDMTNNDINNIGVVKFANVGTITPSPGHLHWNEEDKTLSFGTIKGSEIDIGQETIIPILNQTGLTIPNGAAVGYAGTVGMSGILNGKLFVANGSDRPEFFLGLATHEILSGEIGHVTTFGQVRGLNTSGYTVGDVLYVSPTIAGELTNIKPSAPDQKITVGVVISSHANVGAIEVFVARGNYLGDDHNSEFSTPANNDVIYWNSTNGRWENKNHIGSGGTEHSVATTSANGFMSSADKIKLNGIATGATANVGTVTSIAAGNGLNFTTITGSGSVTLGTPSSITSSSTNSVTATSHTHLLGDIDCGTF